MPSDIEIELRRITEANTPEEAAKEVQRNNEIVHYLDRTAAIFESVHGDREVPAPICVQIEVTGNCGAARCKLCHRWMDRTATSKELSYEEIRTLLKELAGMGTKSIVLSGGEPLTRPDFAAIVDEAGSHDLAIGIITDGTHMTPKIADSLARFASWVTVSLDAPNAQAYKRVRGWDGFDQVMSGLRALAVAREKHRSSVIVSTSLTISALNVDDAVATAEWFQSHRDLVDWMRFKFAHGLDQWQTKQLAPPAMIQKLARQLIDASRDRPSLLAGTNIDYLIKHFLKDTTPQDLASGLPIQLTVFQPGHSKNRCYTPYLFALVDPLAGVYPCCYLYFDNHAMLLHAKERAQFCMGSLRDHSFRDIWLGERYEHLRTVPCAETARVCPECTRHYQHNRTLNQLMDLYRSLDESDKVDYDTLCRALSSGSNGEVWF